MSNDKTLATAKHGGCVQLGTPSSRWASAGEPDPHGNRYDCERAALAMGDLSDDELANAVFMHGDQRPSMAQFAAGVMLPIAYLTAAKDRIRWLSRALVAAQAEKVAQPSPGGQGDERSQFEEYRGGDCERDAQGYYTNARTAQDWAMWQAALAARQPVECENVAEVKTKLTPREWSILMAAVGDARAARQPVERSFQAGVAEWMGQCFLPSLYSNMTERGDRLLEEVLELLQAHGYDKARIPTLVDYVFGRPVGEPAQEVGGVMVTLAGYCWVAGLDMHAAGDAELARISQADVMAKIRAKQEAKSALHFDTPLPGNAVPPAQAVDLGELRRAVCVVNVVGQIDGHDVVRRNSVLDVIDSKAVGNG